MTSPAVVARATARAHGEDFRDARARLLLLVLPSVAAGGIALWGPSTASVNLFSILTIIPLAFFYVASPNRNWDTLQVLSIVAIIFIPVSSIFGLQIGLFEVTIGVVIAQISLTLFALILCSTLYLLPSEGASKIVLSPRVNHGSVLVVAATAFLLRVVIPIPVVGDRLLFAATVYAAAAAASSTSVIAGIRWRYVALSAALFLTYYFTVFTGFGRLLIAALGFAIVLGVTGARSSSFARSMAVVALIPLLAIASSIEQSRSLDSQSVSLGAANLADGLGSVLGPLGTFGDAIDRDLEAGRDIVILPERSTATGSTIVAAVVSPVPRAVWPGKPSGIGRAGFVELYPEIRNYVSEEHTLAFMLFGEFYFEFGLVGIVTGAGIFGVALVRVERRRASAVARQEVWSRERLTMYVLLLAGIPDLIWGGLFGLAGRTLIRMFLLAGMLGGISLLRAVFTRSNQQTHTPVDLQIPRVS